MKNGSQAQILLDLAEKVKASGETRQEIAYRAGVTERQIYHVLACDRNVSARILSNIARAVGYDVRLVKSR
jgi:transcriptional regulator with XRE-family HTH domain